ncbi:MAG: hypothetical protein KC994_02515 [Candidatus Omnitrophica bacterium]|nr:hypothetical protein [Candidatus Omnitrophota bacterium]
MSRSYRPSSRMTPNQYAVIVILPLICATQVFAATYYVSESAPGMNLGTDWYEAFRDLQSALAVAVTSDSIWVAQGVYVPGASRDSTFEIPPNIDLIGGFPGVPGQEGMMDVRDSFAYPTILSGDVDGNDLNPDGDFIAESTAEIQGGNAYHVVTGFNLDNQTRVIGFYITAGQANGVEADADGGGMSLSNASPILFDLRFHGNMAISDGGAIKSSNSLLLNQLVALEFVGNYAGNSGGAIHVQEGGVRVIASCFEGNGATNGGAIATTTQFTSPIYSYIQDTLFMGNRAQGEGGAFYADNIQGDIINSVFSGNRSDQNGGGIYISFNAGLTMINSTLVSNLAGESGGGLTNNGQPLSIANSIFWNNVDPDLQGTTSQILGPSDLVDSLVQGGCPGQANCGGVILETDPLFLDPDGEDGVVGTLDDNLRLSLLSPCIDAGNNQHLPPGISEDVFGDPRIVNDVVDLGAFESQQVLLQNPANVRAAGAEGSVRLVWDSNPEAYLTGYNVYRSAGPVFDPTSEILLNPDGLLFDPTFVDDSFDSLPNGTMLYYQVEAVAATQGLAVTARSQTAEAVLGEYVLYLPRVRASTMESISRYPLSLFNARGVIEAGLDLVLTYPDFIENVSFERTALTEDFAEIAAEVSEASRRIHIFKQTFKGTAPPVILNGEGSLFNLTFNVKPGTPLGTLGSMVIDTTASHFFTAGGNVASPRVVGPNQLQVQNQYRYGDVNGDGILSVSDVVLAASFALEVPFNNREFTAGDLNADGLLDIADLNLIRSRNALKSTSEGDSTGNSKGGVADTFQLDLLDAAFETIPGNVDMGVSMTPPTGETGEMAGAAMTIEYASDLLELNGVDLVGETFDELFYDQRDYSRHFEEGRVKVIVSSPANKMVSGEFLKLNFKSKGTPMVSETDVTPKTAKLSRANGSDEGWVFAIQLLDGKVLFDAMTPTDTPTPTATETPTQTPTSTATETPTPTSTLNVDYCEDGVINAGDLLKFLEAFKEQHMD